MKQFINEIRSGKRHINPKLIKARNIIVAVVLGTVCLEIFFGCIFGVTPLYILYIFLTH